VRNGEIVVVMVISYGQAGRAKAPEHYRHNLQRCGFRGLGKIAMMPPWMVIASERDG
jgi:hypothetical protein